ncbi:MAG: peptidoglycan DD-metalloendopeptidase family protein [Clostridia bacterium]|nr:peptidoglycan DD-metalloendopeptidase family protein [Clostridium sp.]
MYKVSISGEELGYVESKLALEESVKEDIINDSNKNVETVDLKEQPIYELKLVNRNENTEEDKIIEKAKEDATVTYKYYEVALNNNVVETVDTSKEAEELVSEIKNDGINENINLSIVEKYTSNSEEIKTNDLEVAKVNIENKVSETIKEIEKQEEEKNAIADINGIKLATLPVTGTISSRYGVSSRIRKSNHTGLDIAATTGTPIKVMADGVVTNASYSGSYGNLVKVDHGNGVETWYAHTSKMYVKKGQEVKAGDEIATVGSTGNSTGPHLHLEIRLNGEHINPQKYVYK